MTEDKARTHAAWTGWLTLALGIAGFWIARETYKAEQETTRKQDKAAETARADQAKRDTEARGEEYKRRFWEKQLELYVDACRSASTLATITNRSDPQYVASRLRFEQLYHGELCIVESRAVETKMVEFRNLLEKTNPSRKELQDASIELARECRKSSEIAWDVKLGELGPKLSAP